MSQYLKNSLVDLQQKLHYWQQSTELENGRNEVLRMVARGASVQESLQTLCEKAQVYNAQLICSVLKLDAEHKTLHPLASVSLPDFYCQALDGVEIGIAVGSCGTAAFTKKRTIVENINTHPYWAQYKDLALSAGVQSCWSEPIIGSNGRVYGTFAIYYAEPCAPTPEDIHFIEVSANLAAVVFDNEENKQQLIAANEKLSQSLDQRTVELEKTNKQLTKALETEREAHLATISQERKDITKSLVVGIAHEINTPVGVVLTAADHAQQKLTSIISDLESGKALTKRALLKDLHSLEQAMKIKVSNLHRTENLLSRFKEIDTDSIESRETCYNLQQFFEDLAEATTSMINQHKLTFDVDNIAIKLSKSALWQVMLHLIENSVVHGFSETTSGIVNISAAAQNGQLTINYQDNGIGIPEHIGEQIFQPFFVKERSKKSIGLGLNVVTNIVRHSFNGDIKLMKSPENSGTRFEITSPIE